MKHNTTRPDGVDMETKVERVLADLRELDSVSMTENVDGFTNVFRFMSDGPTKGDVPSSVLNILAEHDVYILGEQDWNKPTWAAIHLED